MPSTDSAMEVSAATSSSSSSPPSSSSSAAPHVPISPRRFKQVELLDVAVAKAELELIEQEATVDDKTSIREVLHTFYWILGVVDDQVDKQPPLARMNLDAIKRDYIPTERAFATLLAAKKQVMAEHAKVKKAKNNKTGLFNVCSPPTPEQIKAAEIEHADKLSKLATVQRMEVSNTLEVACQSAMAVAEKVKQRVERLSPADLRAQYDEALPSYDQIVDLANSDTTGFHQRPWPERDAAWHAFHENFVDYRYSLATEEERRKLDEDFWYVSFLNTPDQPESVPWKPVSLGDCFDSMCGFRIRVGKEQDRQMGPVRKQGVAYFVILYHQDGVKKKNSPVRQWVSEDPERIQKQLKHLQPGCFNGFESVWHATLGVNLAQVLKLPQVKELQQQKAEQGSHTKPITTEEASKALEALSNHKSKSPAVSPSRPSRTTSSSSVQQQHHQPATVPSPRPSSPVPPPPPSIALITEPTLRVESQQQQQRAHLGDAAPAVAPMQTTPSPEMMAAKGAADIVVQGHEQHLQAQIPMVTAHSQPQTQQQEATSSSAVAFDIEGLTDADITLNEHWPPTFQTTGTTASDAEVEEAFGLPAGTLSNTTSLANVQAASTMQQPQPQHGGNTGMDMGGVSNFVHNLVNQSNTSYDVAAGLQAMQKQQRQNSHRRSHHHSSSAASALSQTPYMRYLEQMEVTPVDPDAIAGTKRSYEEVLASERQLREKLIKLEQNYMLMANDFKAVTKENEGFRAALTHAERKKTIAVQMATTTLAQIGRHMGLVERDRNACLQLLQNEQNLDAYARASSVADVAVNPPHSYGNPTLLANAVTSQAARNTGSRSSKAKSAPAPQQHQQHQQPNVGGFHFSPSFFTVQQQHLQQQYQQQQYHSEPTPQQYRNPIAPSPMF